MYLSTPTSPASRTVHNNLACFRQWASRPASERFWTIEDLRDHTKGIFDESAEIILPNRLLSVQAVAPSDNPDDPGNVLLRAHSGPAQFNHWSFGQFCNRLQAPAQYLRTLPAERAADLLNFELGRHADDTAMLWLHGGESDTALAITSEKYGRIPYVKVCDALLSLPSEWRVPPARPSGDDPRSRPATATDVLSGNRIGLSIKEGDLIAPAGVYGDDRSIFVFMVNEERPVSVSPQETLYRGFYIENSEVGNSCLSITIFDYLAICGNHIIWGCRNVQEMRIKHLGEKEDLETRFHRAFAAVREFADADTSRECELIAAARTKTLGKDKESTIDMVSDRSLLSRRLAGQCYDLADAYADIHGAPNTIWGFASGMTRLSQTLPYADARDELDRNARRVLLLAGSMMN
ncbi:hypothetical protein CVU37_04885 [candidate division BRC1 bacterium HGW-BRC1-1]|jgi:hypothetical protein|nr:MAG: hypothetical protein CVU37_04885 [candidate division BRC1 bacterium HGW-BRC1-1]